MPEKTIREGVREAEEAKGDQLREDTPDEKGKPEAVNLEREEPVTNAARRRDSFDKEAATRARPIAELVPEAANTLRRPEGRGTPMVENKPTDKNRQNKDVSGDREERSTQQGGQNQRSFTGGQQGGGSQQGGSQNIGRQGQQGMGGSQLGGSQQGGQKGVSGQQKQGQQGYGNVNKETEEEE